MPDEVRRQLADHAQAEDPNEACGLVAFRDGVAERYIRGRNAAQVRELRDWSFAHGHDLRAVELDVLSQECRHGRIDHCGLVTRI